MAELIDKKNLFNNLFVRNGKVCPNNDIDNFPTTIDVKEVKKAILEQPTTTEAEIRAKAYDKVCNAISNLLSGDTKHLEGGAYYKELAYIEVLRMVEQLKEE